MSRYETPAAFRDALEARLKHRAEEGPWSYNQLRRQIAYDRLLTRLYTLDKEWVVKGAIALLARNIGVRGSLDIDAYRAKAAEAAEAEVREAAALDLGDWFRFEVGARTKVADDSEAVRLPIMAYTGQRLWERFSIDLVGVGVGMTGQPEDVPAIAPIDLPELEQTGYRAYPLVDHVADKIAATFDRYGSSQSPSTRYRDLVDLVAIARGATVDAAAQLHALSTQAERRSLTLPKRFEVPDRALWEPGYAKEAADSLLTDTQTLDEALAIVQPFADPLLDGSARGHWDPERQAWVQNAV